MSLEVCSSLNRQGAASARSTQINLCRDRVPDVLKFLIDQEGVSHGTDALIQHAEAQWGKEKA